MKIQGTVQDLLKAKSGDLCSTSPDTTVYDAVRIMGEKNIGALLVIDRGSLVGILSERDYSRKVVLKGRTSRDTLVSEILSAPVISVRPDDGVAHCMDIMTSQRIRYLPVLKDDGQLVGLVSMGDVVQWVMLVQNQTIQMLEGYIAGEYPG